MVPRTLHHTILALEAYELGELWQHYGLVGDVVVSSTIELSSSNLLSSSSPLQKILNVPISTS